MRTAVETKTSRQLSYLDYATQEGSWHTHLELSANKESRPSSGLAVWKRFFLGYLPSIIRLLWKACIPKFGKEVMRFRKFVNTSLKGIVTHYLQKARCDSSVRSASDSLLKMSVRFCVIKLDSSYTAWKTHRLTNQLTCRKSMVPGMRGLTHRRSRAIELIDYCQLCREKWSLLWAYPLDHRDWRQSNFEAVDWVV